MTKQEIIEKIKFLKILLQLRELIVKIRASPLRREKLSNACKNNDINDLKPILDVPTRWNSTFEMIKRALQLRIVSFL